MNGISLLCPTRGRPDNIRRLVGSAHRHATGPLEFAFYVDEDDPTRNRVRQIAGQCIPDPAQSHIQIVEGPRVVLSQMWNECAKVAHHDVMMHCGDDLLFHTPGWDRLVLDRFEQFPDRIVLVYGRDGIHNQNLATHGFLHRRWVDTVGYFVPPLFASDYNDTWLDEVARKIGRREYVPEVYYEHMHPAVGKAPMDLTHQQRLQRHVREQCAQIWRTTAHLRDQDAQKLRAAIDGDTQ